MLILKRTAADEIANDGDSDKSVVVLRLRSEDLVRVTVLGIEGSRVRLGFEAGKDVAIVRGEVLADMGDFTAAEAAVRSVRTKKGA